MIKRFFILLFILSSFALSAQDAQMADAFRSEGKIYVVIGVIAIVFVALVFYMVMMEQKLKKLEEEFKNKK
jgi:CcmD family protein